MYAYIYAANAQQTQVSALEIDRLVPFGDTIAAD